MALPIATRQLSLQMPSTGLAQGVNGPVAFRGKAQKQALAEAILPRVIKANNIQPQRFAKLKGLGLGFQTQHQRLKLVNELKANNTTQIQQAVEANTKELADIDRQLAKTDLNPTSAEKLEQRKTHLQQENTQLEAFTSQLGDRDQILGFMGNSSNALVKLTADKSDSFASHGFALVRDANSGKVSLKAVETDQLNHEEQVLDGATSHLLSELFRKGQPADRRR